MFLRVFLWYRGYIESSSFLYFFLFLVSIMNFVFYLRFFLYLDDYCLECCGNILIFVVVEMLV